MTTELLELGTEAADNTAAVFLRHRYGKALKHALMVSSLDVPTLAERAEMTRWRVVALLNGRSSPTRREAFAIWTVFMSWRGNPHSRAPRGTNPV